MHILHYELVDVKLLSIYIYAINAVIYVKRDPGLGETKYVGW